VRQRASAPAAHYRFPVDNRAVVAEVEGGDNQQRGKRRHGIGEVNAIRVKDLLTAVLIALHGFTLSKWRRMR
jgi:hypothetical protein